MQSLAGTMTRVSTVTSMLKRFLSRDSDSSRPGSAINAENPPEELSEKPKGKFNNSASSASIAGKYPGFGSMKIADQVIEEVDEQMTITSLRGQHEVRPTAQSIFAQAPLAASDPVDVPGRVPPPSYMRVHSAVIHGIDEAQSSLFPPGGVDGLLSTSAPTGRFTTSLMPEAITALDPKTFGSQETTKSLNIEEIDSTPAIPDDDFEKLRQNRELERQERQKQKLARSISTQQGLVNQIELQEMLLELKNQTTSGNSTPTNVDRKSGTDFDMNLS